MQPTGEQLQRIESAIFDAYDHGSLTRMLHLRLDQRLDGIVAGSENFTVTVHAVVLHYATQPDGLNRLLAALQTDNPGNQNLVQVCTDLSAVAFDPLPAPAAAAQRSPVAWWLWVAGAVVAAGIGLALYWSANRSTAVITPPSVPVMNGDLNIAVAAFGTMASDGTVGAEAEANGLADTIFAELQTELAPVAAEVGLTKIEWLGPEAIGVISGATEDERAANAVRVATQHRADLLIYGHVSNDSSTSTVAPWLYVAGTRLIDAQEMVDAYPVGAPLEVEGNLTQNLAATKDVRDQLKLRADAFARFALGLGDFARNRFDKAAQYFADANERAKAAAIDGREVLLLFLGSTAASQGDLALAGHYYEQAHTANPDYARAQLGLAQVEFQRGKDSCQAGEIDADAIARAIDGYRNALTALDQSGLAEIPTKVAFLLGQAYLCQSQAGVADKWAEFNNQMNQVLKRYETTKSERLRYIAADAHNLLGLSAISQAGKKADNTAKIALWRTAAEHNEQVIALSPHPVRRAIAALWLAHLTLVRGKTEQTTDFCAVGQQYLAQAEELSKAFQDKNPSAAMDEYQAFHDDMVVRYRSECQPGP